MIDTPNGCIERDAKIIISPYHLEIYWLSFKDLPVDHDLLVGDHCSNVTWITGQSKSAAVCELLYPHSRQQGASSLRGHLWGLRHSTFRPRKWKGNRWKLSLAVSQEVTPMALDQSHWPEGVSGQRDWCNAIGVTSCSG